LRLPISVRKQFPCILKNLLTPVEKKPKVIENVIMKRRYFSLLLLVLCTYFVNAQYINTLAGNGSSGYTDATGTAARFQYPSAVAVYQATGDIYVADGNNSVIRKITPVGVVTTVAGNGTAGYADGTGTAAQFNRPWGLTINQTTGDIYVADTENHRIRKITSGGVVTTVAGSGIWGILDETLLGSRFYMPSSVAMDESTGKLYVTDFSGHDVRVIDVAGDNVSLLAGAGNGVNNQYADGTGTTARFYHPTCIIFHGGNLYVADEDNHCIRKVTPTGVVTTFSGLGQNPGSADGTSGSGGTARFSYPRAMAFDASGNMYVAGYVGLNIRKIDPAGNVTTFAGTGTIGYVDGLYASAKFYYPGGIAVNTSTGTIYIADTYNHAIRQTASQAMPVTFGTISARLDNDDLVVSWTSLSESNNVGYDIEASADGVNFKKIGSVLSKANDGYSSVPQEYSFSTPFKTALQGMALLFGFIALGFRKRSRLIALGFVAFGLSLFALSCQKNTGEALDSFHQQLFIRIKQVDKNGAVSYSRIIKVD